MSFDVNILCNGSRCKLYNHRGKTFIEAKEGSEYVIEIKNNSWEKILAVVSVDGLNVVDGDPATDNGTGYVLEKYTSQKLYGFQYSKENVATFKFGAVGAVKIDPATGKPELDPATGKEIPLGYAASKGDGSEKNVGVIGVRIWDEVPQPPPPLPPPPPPPISCSYTISSSYSSMFAGCCGFSGAYNPDPTGWTENSHLSVSDMSLVGIPYCCNSSGVEPKFDIETQWGESKAYKVKETAFEKREIVHSVDIFYASRESLIAMGVDLGSERKVSFPESFKETKYAKPPKGWRG